MRLMGFVQAKSPLISVTCVCVCVSDNKENSGVAALLKWSNSVLHPKGRFIEQIGEDFMPNLNIFGGLLSNPLFY